MRRFNFLQRRLLQLPVRRAPLPASAKSANGNLSSPPKRFVRASILAACRNNYACALHKTCRVSPPLRTSRSSSGACALEPGAYIKPVENPAQPAANDSSRMPAIWSSCAAVGVPCPGPQTAIRKLPCPTSESALSFDALSAIAFKYPAAFGQPQPSVLPRIPEPNSRSAAHIARIRKRRKPAIAHHLQRYALLQLLLAPFEHLQIGVAVDVDKARRRHLARAINRLAICRCDIRSNRFNPLATQQNRPYLGRRARPIHTPSHSSAGAFFHLDG